MNSGDIFANMSDARKESTSKDGKKSDAGEKSKNDKNAKTSSTDNTSSTKPIENDNLSKEIKKMNQSMTTGFSVMKNSLANLGESIADKIAEGMMKQFEQRPDYEEYYEEEYEEEDDDTVSVIEDKDLFDSLSENLQSGDKTRGEIKPSLARLVEQCLSLKLEEENLKKLGETYLKPKNIKFIDPPRINKPIWESMGPNSQKQDNKMQTIQKFMLRSVLPTIEAIEILDNGREDAGNLEIDKVIKNLIDSISFIGAANVEIVKKRKESIKRELPSNMQGLCRESENFSSSYLFGDDLNSKIKEVSELNKVSNKMKKSSFTPRNFPQQSVRGSYVRGRGRGMRRWPRTPRGNFRYSPYAKNMAAKNDGPKKVSSLNKSGPSRE